MNKIIYFFEFGDKSVNIKNFIHTKIDLYYD